MSGPPRHVIAMDGFQPSRRQGPLRGGAAGGFTLLEVTLVIVILAIFVGVAIPRFQDPTRQAMQSEARRLTKVFRLLRSEAILHESSYRLNYDLETQRYFVTSDDPRASLDGYVSELGTLADDNPLPTGVRIADVVFPEFGARVNQGQAYTVFYPDGNIDKTVIHLGTDREATTLYVNPMSNRLELTAGYHEIPYN